MKKNALNLGKLLHLRALNHLRREHPLTYLGSRILAESVHTSILDDWTTTYLQRRATTGREPVYWQHSLFKGFKKSGEPDFRNCLIGSPTTHLLEVWTLWKISQEDAFSIRPSVYSNLWPHASSHHIYRPFMSGYSSRERAITEAAKTLNKPYVVILDLKGFYPNVDKELAFERFKKRVDRSLIRGNERESVLHCASGVCHGQRVKGLPIGPPLAHVLASVFLEGVDVEMERRFSGRYFRYVDDVAFVVEKREVDVVKALFDKAVKREGLSVNEDKTDVQRARVWHRHVESRMDSRQELTFGGFIGTLSQYLAHNPSEFDMLRSSFRDEGFSLPFTRVKEVAEYRPFRRLAKRVLRYFSIDSIFSDINPKNLLDDARYLRRQFEERAIKITATEMPNGGIQRRWASQNLRYTFNRLLYLVPRERLSKYEALLPNNEDLAQTRATYNAMGSGNMSQIVHFSGPAVSAFAQMWSETQTDKPQIVWPLAPKPHERDSVMTLALYKLCDPPPEWIATFVSETGYNQTALKLSSNPYPKERSHCDFSYIDEVETLLLGRGIDPLKLLRTRFDKDEDVVLPALNLGATSEVDMEGGY